MPLVPLLLAVLALLALPVALPLLLVQRYRLGKARRLGRRWVAAINLLMMIFSAALFLWVAAFMTFWVPDALRYSALGVIAGCILGLLGLVLTRWEATPRTMHYTPNRWLVLIITFAVALRLLYGFWRAWQAWGVRVPGTSWLASAGVGGSLAVGAMVIGYYVTYSAGVSWRLRRHRKQKPNE
ncbi:MAG: DUF1453 domain-containing protein [Verrucomicrobiota bacterium]|nr:DUF1453 domain-containing protein [Verrucomicrobiota bacterium]